MLEPVLEMIPHQKMPAANPDPEQRLGVEKPVVTIQTMNNKLNPAVPVRTQAVTPGPREHHEPRR